MIMLNQKARVCSNEVGSDSSAKAGVVRPYKR
jgi:hypothetical protein